MFWKKKKIKTDTLQYISDSKRESFRYEFHDGQGFTIAFKAKKTEVVNIGAGGMAFKNIDFHPFDSDMVKFKLDIPDFSGNSWVMAKIKILEIDKKNICHSIFEHCDDNQIELIHKYVLEMQKNDLAH